jgi:hypothetical protein
LTLSDTTIKDECANLVVETSMEGATLILVQQETTGIHVAIAPSPFTATKDLGVDVKIEVIKPTIMEE